ncbi:MAG TPA: acetolactate decarboxylase [Longimicrobium sp.]|nr:acetolactate decarboxylase [Longimicrobium sp.]
MSSIIPRAATLLAAAILLTACGADPAPNGASSASDSSASNSSASASGSAAATVWQLAPAQLLIQGGYDGILSVAEVQRHGDLGLAGADKLNGEMVLVDGQFYQFLSSGQVVQPPSTMRLPFAAVTRWEGGRDVAVQPGLAYPAGMAALDPQVPDTNAFYAVRIEGTWDTLVVRTFREQTPPYPPLKVAQDSQVVQTLVNVRGTMVGFRQPPYTLPMTLPGYHLHFITDDHSRGGHVLSFTARDVQMQVSPRPEFTVHMPPVPPAP